MDTIIGRLIWIEFYNNIGYISYIRVHTYTVRGIMYSLKRRLYTDVCTVYTVQCTVHIHRNTCTANIGVHCTKYHVQRILYIGVPFLLRI